MVIRPPGLLGVAARLGGSRGVARTPEGVAHPSL